jgi:hypothetical protein
VSERGLDERVAAHEIVSSPRSRSTRAMSIITTTGSIPMSRVSEVARRS